MEENYEPYGKEWIAEMNKHTKAELIMAIAKLELTLQAFENKNEKGAKQPTINVVKSE